MIAFSPIRIAVGERILEKVESLESVAYHADTDQFIA